MHIRKQLELLRHCESGVVLVEFAFAVIVLLVMFIGTVEVTRYALIVQKLEKTVSSIADVVAQTNPNSGGITDTEMSQLMSAVTDMMSPYTTGASDPNIRIIVTDIYYNTTAASPNTPVPAIQWQYCGGGSGTQHSKLYASTGYVVTHGQIATLANAGLPASFTGSLNTPEEFIVAEVFYNFNPVMNQTIFTPVGFNTLVYRTVVYMPRLGALSSFVPATSPATTTCP